MPIKPGRYIITNTEYKRVVFLPNADDGTLLETKVEEGQDYGEQWDINALGHSSYSIVNIGHKKHVAGEKVVGGSGTHQEWIISEAGVEGKYTISTTGTELFWASTSDPHIVLRRLEPDCDRFLWTFQGVRPRLDAGEADSFASEGAGLTQVSDVDNSLAASASSAVVHSPSESDDESDQSELDINFDDHFASPMPGSVFHELDITKHARSPKTMRTVATDEYRIKNVKSCNIAVLEDPDSRTSVRASTLKGKPAEKWDVSKVGNGNYYIQNIGSQTYARVKKKHQLGGKVKGNSESYQWVIQKVPGHSKKFRIATSSDPELFWGLADNELRTRVTLADGADDERNWWVFGRCD